MRKWARRLVFAIQFMTRFPIKTRLFLQPDDFPRMLIFFPIIGALVGVFAGVFAWIGLLSASNIVAGVLTTLGYVLISGAMHVVGLAKTFDSVSGKQDHDMMIQRMRDRVVGIRGTAMIAVDLILHSLLIFVLLQQLDFWYAVRFLIAVPVVGRLAIVGGSVVSCSVYQEDKFRAVIDGSKFPDLLVALVFTLIMLLLLLPWWIALILTGIGIVLGTMTSKIMNSSLSGVSGEVLGCINEVTQMLCLLTICLISMK